MDSKYLCMTRQMRLVDKSINALKVPSILPHINPLPPAIASGGNFVWAMLNCCFPATAA